MNTQKISDYLSELSGVCHNGFEIKTENDKTFAVNIKWDVDDKDDLNYLPDKIQIPNNILKESECD